MSTGSRVPPLRSRTVLTVGVAGLLLLASGVAVSLLRRPAPEPVAAPTVTPVAELPAQPPEAVPAPGPITPPMQVVTQAVEPRASAPSKVNTERKPPLLARIERLERKLRTSSLAADEKESAHNLLKKARTRAESASTSDERKQVQRNLDIWERQYLGN